MTARTLLLTPWYLPYRVLRWQDAITLLYLEKADVVVEYASSVRSPSVEVKLPAVLRARRPPRGAWHQVKFSRVAVYTRDDYTCQYCRHRFDRQRLSFDHVVPRSAGGRTEWANIVTACRACNGRKADRTCDEAGMWPMKTPIRPKSLLLVARMPSRAEVPLEWRDFLPAAAR